MIIYQGECSAWTRHVKQQNAESHIAANDQYAGEATALREWCKLEDIPADAKFMGRKHGADVYRWRIK